MRWRSELILDDRVIRAMLLFFFFCFFCPNQKESPENAFEYSYVWLLTRSDSRVSMPSVYLEHVIRDVFLPDVNRTQWHTWTQRSPLTWIRSKQCYFDLNVTGNIPISSGSWRGSRPSSSPREWKPKPTVIVDGFLSLLLYFSPCCYFFTIVDAVLFSFWQANTPQTCLMSLLSIILHSSRWCSGKWIISLNYSSVEMFIYLS